MRAELLAKLQRSLLSVLVLVFSCGAASNKQINKYKHI